MVNLLRGCCIMRGVGVGVGVGVGEFIIVTIINVKDFSP